MGTSPTPYSVAKSVSTLKVDVETSYVRAKHVKPERKAFRGRGECGGHEMSRVVGLPWV